MPQWGPPYNLQRDLAFNIACRCQVSWQRLLDLPGTGLAGAIKQQPKESQALPAVEAPVEEHGEEAEKEAEGKDISSDEDEDDDYPRHLLAQGPEWNQVIIFKPEGLLVLNLTLFV